MSFRCSFISKSNGEPSDRQCGRGIFRIVGMLPSADAAVEAVYGSDWGRIVATLIRLFGDFDLAEEAAQEAFAAALVEWRASGVPKSPRAWIVQTARHKAIDRLRRRTKFEEILRSSAPTESAAV